MASEEVQDVGKDVAPSWVRRIEEAQQEAKKHRNQDPAKPEADKEEQRHEDEHGEEGEQ
jgi:hypothetical protein